MRSTAPTAKIHRSKVMEHRTSECRAISTQSAKFRHSNGCNSTTHTSFPRSRWNFVGLADFYTSQPPAMYLATGTMQVIIDERADEAQRKALATVLRGARQRRQRPTGGFTVPCRRLSMIRSSNRSISRWTSRGAPRAFRSRRFSNPPAGQF